MENHLSPEFISYYREHVRPVAVKCTKEFQTMYELENGKSFPDDHPDIVSLKAKKDGSAVWYIGLFIGDIDRAIFHGIRLNTLNSLSQLHGTLNSEGYWTRLWNNDFSTEEAQNIKELGKHMKELLTKL